jgi:hypothetical protein
MQHKKELAKELAGVGKPWDGCRPPAGVEVKADAKADAEVDVEGEPGGEK